MKLKEKKKEKAKEKKKKDKKKEKVGGESIAVRLRETEAIVTYYLQKFKENVSFEM